MQDDEVVDWAVVFVVWHAQGDKAEQVAVEDRMGGNRRSQDRMGGNRRSQDRMGGNRRSQDRIGGTRRSWE